MPVFPALRCAFVHIPKTAGKSVLDAFGRASSDVGLASVGVWDVLEQADEPERLVLSIRANFRVSTLRDFPQQHLPASALRAIVGESAWRELFSFSIVRNPWDLVVSTYHFNRTHTASVGPLGVDPDLVELHTRAPSFRRFVRMYTVMRGDMTSMLVDESGRELVDFVGRYESIDADIASVARRLGVALDLPRVNSSEHEPYRSYYDDESREIVRRHFQRDIERFGYEF